MKNLTYLVLALSLFFVTACGEDVKNDVAENNDEINLKGFEELDLSQWGFDMLLMIPNVEDNGEPKVTLTERGALEVVVGKSFGIEIMFGEGDINLLKSDLEGSLVFKSEIIKEEEDALLYTQDIPESGIKTKNHFFYRKQFGADIYEIRNLVDGDYGIKVIEKMLSVVKKIKSKTATSISNEEVS